jgi:hypothetical protein
MAHETVWASRGKTPQGRPDSKPPAQTEEAGEAQERRERYKHQPTRGPRRVAGHPPEIRHLGVRVGICYDNGGTGEQRAILHLRRWPQKSNPKNQEMLGDVNPIYDRESGRQKVEKNKFGQRNTDEEKIAGPSP